MQCKAVNQEIPVLLFCLNTTELYDNIAEILWPSSKVSYGATPFLRWETFTLDGYQHQFWVWVGLNMASLMILWLSSIWSKMLQVPGLISQNGDISSYDVSSPKKSWFQISVKLVTLFGYKKRLRILQLSIPYCVNLIMVTITGHIFINIFQTVNFSAVKLTRSNEKSMSFLLIPKSHEVQKNLNYRTGLL